MPCPRLGVASARRRARQRPRLIPRDARSRRHPRQGQPRFLSAGPRSPSGGAASRSSPPSHPLSSPRYAMLPRFKRRAAAPRGPPDPPRIPAGTGPRAPAAAGERKLRIFRGYSIAAPREEARICSEWTATITKIQGEKFKGSAEALRSNQFAELDHSRSCLEEADLLNQQKDFFFLPRPASRRPSPLSAAPRDKWLGQK